MEKEMIQVENEKETYEKPVLTKHGRLTEITGLLLGGGSPKSPSPELGCTRF